MRYEFTFTSHFKKHFKTMTMQDKRRLQKTLDLLANNPYHPSLRTKKIQGTVDKFESSVNMDIRIIWFFDGDKIIIVVDVGHHDIVKRFNDMLN